MRRRLGLLLLGPALLVLFAAGIYAIGDAVLAPAPPPDHPGFVDTVLGSRAVVAAIRLAVIFAGVFVVVSVVALAMRGQWLTRVGPVQVADAVAQPTALAHKIAIARIDSLEQELADASQALDRMKRDGDEE